MAKASPPSSRLTPPKSVKATIGSRFDLTTTSGLAAAAALLAGGSASAAILAPAAVVAGPLALLAYHLTRSMSNGRLPTSVSGNLQQPPPASKSTLNEQAEVAIAILKAGKEQGLSEVEIVLESDVGVDVGAHLPKALNVDLKLKAGRNNKTTVRAKYKDA